jgi:hypothetical protein
MQLRRYSANGDLTVTVQGEADFLSDTSSKTYPTLDTENAAHRADKLARGVG